MSRRLRVLMVGTSLSDALSMLRELEEAGYDSVHERIETAEALNSALEGKTWDVVIADYAGRKFGPFDAFEIIKDKGPGLPLIIVAEPISEEIAVSAVQAGVEDVIMKSNLSRLVPAVERALGDKGAGRQRKPAGAGPKEKIGHLASLVEGSTDAIFSTDKKGGLVLFNRGAGVLLGYTPEEVIGQPVSVLFETEEGVKELRRHIKEGGGTVLAFGSALRSKGGKTVPVLLSASTLYDEDGQEAGFVGFCKEAAEGKQAEETTKRFARQKAALAQFISLVHREVEVQSLLDAAVLLTAEALGVEVCEVLRLEESGQALRLVSGVGWPDEMVGAETVGLGKGSPAGSCLEEGGPVVVEDLQSESRFKGAAMLKKHGIVSGLSVPMVSGKFVFGVMGAQSKKKREFSQDDVQFLEAVAGLIVAAVLRQRVRQELDRADEELTRQVRRIEQAQDQLMLAEKVAAMERLTAGVSQDILNPLNVISLRLQMFNKDPSVPPDMTRHLKALEEQANRIARNIRDVLSYARQQAPEYVKVDLNDTVTRALDRLEHDLGQEKITLELRLTEGLPHVSADEEQLQQVVLNLLNNAREAMPEGGRLVLTTGVVQKNGQHFVEFKVKDTGTGFAPEDLEKLFAPFFTTKPEGEGSGLGLYLCQSIIEAHGGTMKAESEKGGGATFAFHLPVSQGKDQDK